MLHHVPHFQTKGRSDSSHRVETEIFAAPFHHLKILVFHAAQFGCLFLREVMPLAQFTEAFPEKFGCGKVIWHSRRIRTQSHSEHRAIKYP